MGREAGPTTGERSSGPGGRHGAGAGADAAGGAVEAARPLVAGRRGAATPRAGMLLRPHADGGGLSRPGRDLESVMTNVTNITYSVTQTM